MSQDSSSMAEEMEEARASSSRRNLTMRNNGARQVAVNFMPSRQLPYNTMRLRRNNSEHNALLEVEAPDASDAPDAADKQADMIVRGMEQHKRLMEDDPEAEQLRREALRDLPQGLTMKRTVRAKLSTSVSLRSKRRPISFWKRLKYRISFAIKRVRERSRDVLFSLELWYGSLRRIEGHFGSAVGSYFYFLRWVFALDLVLAALVLAFLVIPQALHQEHHHTQHITALDFITGMGGLTDSLLFYGHYHSGDIVTSSPLKYNMPFAYFFTMTCLYLMFFVVLCYRTAYSYRRNFIETCGGLGHVFANKVFCGWDFGVVTPQAAKLNANSLYNEFKELLSEQSRGASGVVWWVRAGQLCANTLASALVLAAICGWQAALWLALARPHSALLVSLGVTLALTLAPLLLHLVVRAEFYSARTALYVTLARTWLLHVGTLVVLLVYWSQAHAHQCWETSFGQETYRLVLLDSIICLFVLPLFEFARGFVYKWYKWDTSPEFNIAYNSLSMLYNQAVLWFGAMFSPLLVLGVTLKLLLLFYIKKEVALRACQPSTKIWRAAQTQTVMYMLVTLSLFTSLFALGTLFFRTSSVESGPFRSYSHVYAVLSEGVLGLSQRPALRALIHFLLRPGVIGFVMLFLCVGVYYSRGVAAAQRSMVSLLRHMLVLQHKDKDFLLAAIDNVSNGEWLYSPRSDETQGSEGHTWKYVREVRKPSNSGFQLDVSRPGRASRHEPLLDASRSNRHDDGDTDSSFSWQGSNNYLNK